MDESKKPRCGRCQFWLRTGYGEIHPESEEGWGNGMSECHRRSPGDDGRWPKTNKSSWCGEFILLPEIARAERERVSPALFVPLSHWPGF